MTCRKSRLVHLSQLWHNISVLLKRSSKGILANIAQLSQTSILVNYDKILTIYIWLKNSQFEIFHTILKDSPFLLSFWSLCSSLFSRASLSKLFVCVFRMRYCTDNKIDPSLASRRSIKYQTGEISYVYGNMW